MDEAVIKQIQREGADALLDYRCERPAESVSYPFQEIPAGS